MSDLSFNEFQPVSKDEWKQQALKDLKGKPYESLVQEVSEEIELEPYYTSGEFTALEIPLERQISPWQIRQDFVADDPKLANQQIQKAVANDVGTVGLKIKTAAEVAAFDTLFENIPLDNISIHFIADDHNENCANVFLQAAQKLKFDTAALHGSFNTDPLCENTDVDFTKLHAQIKNIHLQFPKFKSLTLHSQPFHMDGKSAIEELKSLLQKADRYWKGLSAQGLQLSDFLNTVQFSIPVGTNYFLEIAKLRALRWLWLDWQKRNGAKKIIPAFIQAQKSWKFNDPENAYHNMLMHTTEAMAAVIGGCDVLDLQSSDSSKTLSNSFFQEIARNIQLLLKHESYLDKVIDPARGSYYIEKITAEIVQQVQK